MNRTPIAMALASGALVALTACTSNGGKSAVPVSSHAVAGAPVGASPTPTTTAERVAAWWNSTGSPYTSSIISDLSKFSETGLSSGPSGNPTPVLEQASQLADDVSHAQQDAPVPDPKAQAQWAAALHAYDVALTDFEVGGNTPDLALLNKSATELKAAGADLAQAIKTIRQLAGI